MIEINGETLLSIEDPGERDKAIIKVITHISKDIEEINGKLDVDHAQYLKEARTFGLIGGLIPWAFVLMGYILKLTLL